MEVIKPIKSNKIILKKQLIDKKNKDDFTELVNSLRIGNEYHKQKCEKEKDLLKKCVYCKYYLSSQVYGQLLQEYLKEKYMISDPLDHLSGDGVKNGKNIEIKVSLGDAKGQINIVQIRPSHKIDYYMILAYNLFEGEYGGAYLLIIPANEIYSLIPEYGCYAHGTVVKNGKITLNNMYGHSYEYALRPNPLKKTAKSGKLWEILSSKWNKLGCDISL